MTVQPTEMSPLSAWWRHGVILVLVIGFATLSFVTVKTYSNAPPIPGRVTDEQGATLFTRDDIEAGQEVFLKYALMEHGTLWGHGAYLGPDFSAEYLHRLTTIMRDSIARARFDQPFAELGTGAAAEVAELTRVTLKQNRYNAEEDRLVLSPGEVASYEIQKGEWANYFSGDQPAPGLPRGYISDPKELADLTSYFAWAAWACVAQRPGKDYSYTNNFPYDPAAGNQPTTSTYLWSAMSLITLLAGLGAVLFLVGRFDYLGWHGERQAQVQHNSPLLVWKITPSQRVVGLYFAVVALLFLLQALVGGGLAHYRVEPGAFYGIDLDAFCPTTCCAPSICSWPSSGLRQPG